MSGCSVVQTVKSHGEAFQGAANDKKIIKRLACMVKVGTFFVGGLQTPLRQHPRWLKVLQNLGK